MKTPQFDAILACRLNGTRLYGKPLQLIDIEKQKTILEYCVEYIKKSKHVRNICLAISDEVENRAFVPVAEKHGWKVSFGHPQDVLGRILGATKDLGTTHVLRVTSECPFVYFEGIDSLYETHLEKGLDYSSIEKLPEGSGFEIISTSALERSHANGTARNRSELVTSYIFEHQNEFKIHRPSPAESLQRSEVRITVDYPEDLIFCRKIYKMLNGEKGLIPIEKIIQFWDSHPAIRKDVETVGIDWGTGRIWT